jgi:DNA-binding NarL/FixJ family response regulator
MTAAPDAIRVVIVDDHDLIRAGIVSVLQDQEDIVVVGQAGSVDEAIRAVDETAPNVVVMDLKLGDGTSIEATRDIRSAHPDIRVLMLSSFDAEEGVFASLMAGASGYLLKTIRQENLASCIRAINRGENLLDPAVAQTVIGHLRDAARLQSASDDPRLASLSPQKMRVLELVAEGKTNRQIGLCMHLSEKTVKNYVSDILAKLAVVRRVEAAAYLISHRAGGRIS